MLTTSCRWCLLLSVPSLVLASTVAAQAASAAQARPVAIEQPSSTWVALTPAQRAALAPLEADWDTLEPMRQSKWLEIVRRWPLLSDHDQQRLQRRMSRWARMTNEDRSRARLQFQQIRRLSVEQRRAAWEAYQALSPAERHELAVHGKPLPGSRLGKQTARTAVAAPVFKPVGPTLVQAVPGVSTVSIDRLPKLSGPSGTSRSDIDSSTASVNERTLLPKHDVQPADNIHSFRSE